MAQPWVLKCLYVLVLALLSTDAIAQPDVKLIVALDFPTSGEMSADGSERNRAIAAQVADIVGVPIASIEVLPALP